jgi:hypothetical protein
VSKVVIRRSEQTYLPLELADWGSYCRNNVHRWESGSSHIAIVKRFGDFCQLLRRMTRLVLADAKKDAKILSYIIKICDHDKIISFIVVVVADVDMTDVDVIDVVVAI